jgi:hypothetical protein
MNTILCSIANDLNSPVKKGWCTPLFEVISKDVVKSGHNQGAEASDTNTGTYPALS